MAGCSGRGCWVFEESPAVANLLQNCVPSSRATKPASQSSFDTKKLKVHFMSWIQPVTLSGNQASLVPLNLDHAGDLENAVQDGNLWELWYTKVPRPGEVVGEIERRLDLQESGSMIPFTVLNSDGIPIGMTTYMHIEHRFKRVEIGSTWYAKSYQRTAINTQCKLLLLQHAFEALNCIAVELRTSSFNHSSRRAIERLGAKLDGVLRNHQRHSDGTLRDTYVFSIIMSEWPTVKSHLEYLLSRCQ